MPLQLRLGYTREKWGIMTVILIIGGESRRSLQEPLLSLSFPVSQTKVLFWLKFIQVMLIVFYVTFHTGHKGLRPFLPRALWEKAVLRADLELISGGETGPMSQSSRFQSPERMDVQGTIELAVMVVIWEIRVLGPPENLRNL